MTIYWHNIIPSIQMWLWRRLRLKHTHRWQPLTPEDIKRLEVMAKDYPAIVEQILITDLFETEFKKS